MKTTAWIAGFIMAGVTLLTTSCACNMKTWSFSDEDMVKDVRNLKGFERIEVSGSPTVHYTQSDTFSVVVKAPDAIIEDIITEKQGNTLVVRNRGKMGIFNVSFNGDAEMAVYVTSPDLVDVLVNGSGDFLCDGSVDTDKIDITLRGSGDIFIRDLVCDRCEVELIGSGDVSLDRLEAKDVTGLLIGSGDLDMKLCKVDDTRLTLKGSGDIEAAFADGCRSVDCLLQGSGDISLSGRVSYFKGDKNGSGDISINELSVDK